MRALLVVILMVLAAPAASGGAVEAVRGLAQHVDVRYDARLRPRADLSPTAPIRVRITSAQGDPGAQRIEFIGAVAGSFDLRDFLEREDGRPTADLPALPVVVVSHLPPDAGTDLYMSEASWFNWRAHYRAMLGAAAAMWLMVPVAVLVARRMRRAAAVLPPAPPPPPPTLEEQVVEAIMAAGADGATVDERARLELLLFRYFGERVVVPSHSTEDRAATIRAVREHREARDLMEALERWLHERTGGEIDRRLALAALEHLRLSRLEPTSAVPVEVGP